jgi:hypothetical protein
MAFLSGGDTQRMRVGFALLVLAVAGCGVPHELPKQAEEVASVAAEGSLLTHDAAEGGTTETFTREHAKALRKRLRELEPAIENPDLAQLAAKVDHLLRAVSDRPGDGEELSRHSRALDRHAHAAEELAG